MSEPFVFQTDWVRLHWNGTAWVRVAHVVEGSDQLFIIPDGPGKEREENAEAKPAPFFRLDTDQAVKAANDRCVAHLAEKVKRAPSLQPGDHVLLRLSPVEEQRCVLQRRSPTRDTWFLRMVRSDGTLGDETEMPAWDMQEGGGARKVDPIPVKEPSAPRGKVRLKPGCGL